MHAYFLVPVVCISAYLIGAIPFGYLAARLKGVDIFASGSGNIGATNVGRVLGTRYGLLVFVLDFAKGALPTALAPLLQPQVEELLAPGALDSLAGMSAFLGHLFPVYLRFRGGKGVATGAGVVTVLMPLPTLGALLTWLTALAATRFVSLASILAVLALAGLRLLLTPAPFSPEHRWITEFALLAAALVVGRHAGNIGRLFKGTENRIKDNHPMLAIGRSLHVLSLGLWFGSGFFFSFVAALLLFQTFEHLAATPEGRPDWLPEAMTKEQGTRLAGIAVGPMFPWYFAIQGICAAIAFATALPWAFARPRRKLDLLRLVILLLALGGIGVGERVAEHVSSLRMDRYSTDPAVAEPARAAFGAWHGYSLLLNLGTLALSGIALGMAAHLPPRPRDPGRPVTSTASPA